LCSPSFIITYPFYSLFDAIKPANGSIHIRIKATIQKILCLFDNGNFRIAISAIGQYQPRTATTPIKVFVIIVGSCNMLFKDTETYEAETGAKRNQNSWAYSPGIRLLSIITHVEAAITHAINRRINCL